LGDFYAQFLSEDIFFLTGGEIPANDSQRILEKDEQVQILHGETEDGAVFTAVFTSRIEMENYVAEDMACGTMSGWDLLSLISANEVVINPASDFCMVLVPEEIENILDHFGSDSITMEEGTEIMIGLPEDDPLDLKKALSDVFVKYPYVQAAYLALFQYEEGQRESLVIGVVFEEGKENPRIFDIAGAAATPFVPKDSALDFYIIDDEDPQSLSGGILELGECFYKKPLIKI
jgi:hypothetical protein